MSLLQVVHGLHLEIKNQVNGYSNYGLKNDLIQLNSFSR